MPEILAKRVSSLPRPTLAPAFSLVPRWRTMMVPPRTASPPKRLTPRRCAFESRPFLGGPKPFLCAISVSLSGAKAPENYDVQMDGLKSVPNPELFRDCFGLLGGLFG